MSRLTDNTLNESPFQNSGLYFNDMGGLDDFHLLDDLQQHQMPRLYSHDMTRDPSSSVEDSVFDDFVLSPTDQPATSISTDSERSPDASTKMRRRAQNRASQRAFRERKDRHLRSLKATLETLGNKHSKLRESYSQQSEAIVALKGRIAELQSQITTFSVQDEPEYNIFNSHPQTEYHPEFRHFDAFSHSSIPSNNVDVIFWQNQNRHASRFDMLQLPALEHLPGFEDLLDLP